MKPVPVEFSQRPRRFPFTTALACAVLGTVALFGANDFWQTRSQQGLVAREISRLQAAQQEQEERRGKQARPDLPAVADTTRERWAWVQRSAFDTAGVLDAVEAAIIRGTRATALTVLPDQQAAHLELEAAKPSDVMLVMTRLNCGGLTPGVWTLARLQSGSTPQPMQASLRMSSARKPNLELCTAAATK